MAPWFPRVLALLLATTAVVVFGGDSTATAQLGEPFVLHRGATVTVQPPGLALTLRSLATDSGCLSPEDCSSMLFRGTLVLRFGDRTELHEVDTMVAPNAPAWLEFADYDVRIDAVRPDAKGQLGVTFALTQHDANTNDHKIASQNEHVVHRIARSGADKAKLATVPIWIVPERTMLSNAGWYMSFGSAEPLSKLEVMPSDVQEWAPVDGRDRDFGTGVGFLDEVAKIQVRGTTPDGRRLGPYTLTFDTLGVLRNEDARSLRLLPATWVQYKGIYAYFSQLVGDSCGLREIRYSINSAALDQRFKVFPCSLTQHGRMPADDGEILQMPSTPEFITVQLVYFDGSESPIRTVKEGLH